MSKSSEPKERLHYLDWLRAFVIFAAFVGHVALPFSGGRWVISSDQFVPIAAVVVGVGSQFVIPSLFLISGAALTFSLGNRSVRRFINERVQRLLIPYAVGVVLLSTVQAYFSALNQGVFQGGFHHYLPEFFSLSRINRLDLSWIGIYGYHLWFLGYLFVFSLLMLPFHALWQREWGRRLNERIVRLCALRGGVLLLGLPFGLLRTTLGLFFGEYQSWTDSAIWLLFMLYGYILFKEPRLQRALWRDAKLIGRMVVLSLIGLFLIAAALLFGARGDLSLQTIVALRGLPLAYVLSMLLVGLNSWALVLYLLCLGKRWLNRDNAIWRYLNEVSLPFYLLHHPIVVVLAYYILQVRTSSTTQFILLFVSSLILTLGTFHLLVQNNGLLRRLMGIRSVQIVVRDRRLHAFQVVFLIALSIFVVLLHVGIQRTAQLASELTILSPEETTR